MATQPQGISTPKPKDLQLMSEELAGKN